MAKMSTLMNGKRMGTLLLLKHLRAALGLTIHPEEGTAEELCQRKHVSDKAEQARKTLFKTIAVGERLNSTPLKQKAGEFLSAGVSWWKSPGGRWDGRGRLTRGMYSAH